MYFAKPALISNPNSGRNKTALAAVDAVARKEGLDHFTPSLEELPDLLHRLAASGVDLLIINGGDGTVDAVIACLHRERPFLQDPSLALLRGGTTNMIHADIGLRGVPAAALARLLRRLWQGRAFSYIERSPLQVRRASGETYYGFFLGLGAVPRAIRFARERYHTKGMNGPLSEFLMMGRMMTRLFRGKVKGDAIFSPVSLHWCDKGGKEQEAECVLGFLTSLRKLLLGLRPIDPCQAMGLLCLAFPYHRLGLILPALLTRSTLPEIPGLGRWVTEEVTLRLSSEWVLDGELFMLEGEEILRVQKGGLIRFVKL